MGAVIIILSKNKDDYMFLDKMGSKSKDVAHPLWANEKFVVPNSSHHFVPTHPSHPWLWSGPNWIHVKSTLRHICCLKLCLDFLWRLMNFIQVVGSSSCIFHVTVPDEIKNNPLEYMKVQILESLSVRMRQQPKGVDHLRCSPSVLRDHSICPFELHQHVEQCLMHCDDNKILP